MKTRFRYALAVAFLVLAPQSLAAQFDAITALFKEVHSITLYGQGAYIDDPKLKGESNCGFVLSGSLCGVGTEVLIDVGGNDDGTHIELGLGASYLRGLASNDTTLEFNAGIRSFPTVSAYFIDIGPEKIRPVQLYAGASIGLLDLQNAQTYDRTGVERGVTANTFEFGLSGGLYGKILGVDLFAEASHRWRRFASLDYSLTETDSGHVPASFPRELDLSGFTVSVGVQFRVKEDEDKSVPMLWTLARVDARPLPAVIEAKSDTGGVVVETELLFGLLSLTPDTAKSRRDSLGTYVIELQSRQVIRTAGGDVRAIQVPGLLPGVNTLAQETGDYRISGGKLKLAPRGAVVAATDSVIYMGDEIRVRHRGTGYGLVFRKPGAETPAKQEDPEEDS